MDSLIDFSVFFHRDLIAIFIGPQYEVKCYDEANMLAVYSQFHLSINVGSVFFSGFYIRCGGLSGYTLCVYSTIIA